MIKSDHIAQSIVIRGVVPFSGRLWFTRKLHYVLLIKDIKSILVDLKKMYMEKNLFDFIERFDIAWKWVKQLVEFKIEDLDCVQKSEKISILKKKIDEVDRKINMVNISSDMYHDWMSEINSLENVQREMLFEKLKIMDKNNCLTNKNKLVLSLKKRHTKRQIYALSTEVGVTTNISVILEVLQNKFVETTRYNKKPLLKDNLFYIMVKSKNWYPSLRHLNSPLSGNNQKFLNGNIEMNEILDAIARAKNNVSPGPDYVPPHFYKLADDVTIKHILDWSNCFMKDNVENDLFERFNLANMVFIPKEKCNAISQSYENLRPISIINTDIKLIMRVMHERLVKFFDLVFPNQINGIRGNGVNNAVWTLHCAFHNRLDSMNIRPVLMRIDVKKAFDTVHTDYLELLLFKYYGVNHSTKLIANLVKNKFSRIIVQNCMGPYFRVKNSLPQGSPLSSTLYSLYVLDLIKVINKYVKGLKIVGIRERLKIVNYCDDFSILCNSQHDIVQVNKIIKSFADLTGTTINSGKSYLLDIKKNKTISNDLYTGEQGKILGIFFGASSKWSMHKYILEIISGIDKILNNNIYRFENMLTKVITVNTLIIPRFIFIASFIPLNKKLIYMLKAKISNFIWSNKKLRLSYDKMAKPLNSGGFNLLDPLLLYENCFVRGAVRFVSKLVGRNCLEIMKLWAVKNIIYKKVNCKFKKLYGNAAGCEDLLNYRKLYLKSIDKAVNDNNVKRNIIFIKKLSMSPLFIDFAVRLCIGMLPTLNILNERRLLFSSLVLCPACKKKDETINHIYLECPFYAFVMRSIFYQVKCPLESLQADTLFPLNLFLKISMKFKKWILIVCKAIWNYRCNMIFSRNKMSLHDYIVSMIVKEFMQDFKVKTTEWLKKFWPLNVIKHCVELSDTIMWIIKQ